MHRPLSYDSSLLASSSWPWTQPLLNLISQPPKYICYLLHMAGQGPALFSGLLTQEEKQKPFVQINSSPNEMPLKNSGMKPVWIKRSS